MAESRIARHANLHFIIIHCAGETFKTTTGRTAVDHIVAFFTNSAAEPIAFKTVTPIRARETCGTVHVKTRGTACALDESVITVTSNFTLVAIFEQFTAVHSVVGAIERYLYRIITGHHSVDDSTKLSEIYDASCCRALINTLLPYATFFREHITADGNLVEQEVSVLHSLTSVLCAMTASIAIDEGALYTFSVHEEKTQWGLWIVSHAFCATSRVAFITILESLTACHTRAGNHQVILRACLAVGGVALGASRAKPSPTRKRDCANNNKAITCLSALSLVALDTALAKKTLTKCALPLRVDSGVVATGHTAGRDAPGTAGFFGCLKLGTGFAGLRLEVIEHGRTPILTAALCSAFGALLFISFLAAITKLVGRINTGTCSRIPEELLDLAACLTLALDALPDIASLAAITVHLGAVQHAFSILQYAAPSASVAAVTIRAGGALKSLCTHNTFLRLLVKVLTILAAENRGR